MSSNTADEKSSSQPTETPTWTYPTRFCRICQEDVAPTVTMYPPGVPPRFQRPIVEYKNEDEYGRLVKPCKCTGSMRYIHELCLLRSRTENRREDSMWKCHTCGYKFNFQKLAIQRFLSSRFSTAALTMLAMLCIMFFLGFVADPIINLYIDPYQSLLGDQDLWDEVELNVASPGLLSSWYQHFMKGLVSMGLVGFLKTVLLNPMSWLNLRHYFGATTSRTSTTGRDRAMNNGWIAVGIGMVTAFYFFYQWVQAIVQISLKRVGNSIVDTQMPGDDDDLKPPPGWHQDNAQTKTRTDEADTRFQTASEFAQNSSTDIPEPGVDTPNVRGQDSEEPEAWLGSPPVMVGSLPAGSKDVGRSSAIDSALDQSWSFAST